MTSLIFTSVDDVAGALRGRLGERGLVGIDGWTGVGKTTLAKSLAETLGCKTYDLDEALDRDQRNYVSALRLDEIAAALTSPTRVLLVSGVCLRQVLQEVERSADLHIYVKRMATWGW